MHSSQFNTPILFLIFNRPDITKLVFQEIRKVRPRQLFISADGPRDGKDDEEKCAAARSVCSGIDWECDVKILFSERNWGCGKGPARGITWFFNHVEEGIILEDDCLPAPSFFGFCELLLQRYRYDYRIMEIGGANLIAKDCAADAHSYYFSEHCHTWGWATWKRAWKLYDYRIERFGEFFVRKLLSESFDSKIERDYFMSIFEKTYTCIESATWWDYQWEFARRINGGLSIVSRNNLIVNIGLGNDATHTLDPKGFGSHLELHDISFPLKHPDCIVPFKKRDKEYFNKTLTTLQTRIKLGIKICFDDLTFKDRYREVLNHTQIMAKHNA